MTTFNHNPANLLEINEERLRLQALDRYNILDTLPEEKLNNIVALASYICGTPISLVSLITQNRQWFKAKIGLELTETPRSLSFCEHAIQSDDILEIPDTLDDIRFYSNPLVTGNPNIRFYAGAPLVNNEGYKLGTLCVIDTQPRELSEAQKIALATLSEQVVAYLELRNKKQELEQEQQQLKVVNQKLAKITPFLSDYLPQSIHNLQVAADQLSPNVTNHHTAAESLRQLNNTITHLSHTYSEISKVL